MQAYIISMYAVYNLPVSFIYMHNTTKQGNAKNNNKKQQQQTKAEQKEKGNIFRINKPNKY